MTSSASRFLLIRHAHVDTGAEAGRMCGWLDLPLSAKGKRQLRELRERSLAREHPVALYTSTLRRALDVAAALEEIWGLPPRPLEALREIHCGELEGVPIEQATRTNPELMARNRAQVDDDFTWPGGESYRQLRRRVLTAFSQIAAAHPGECVAVVTHAGVIAQVLGALKGRRAAEWERDRPAPLSVTEVTWANGAPGALLRFNASD